MIAERYIKNSKEYRLYHDALNRQYGDSKLYPTRAVENRKHVITLSGVFDNFIGKTILNRVKPNLCFNFTLTSD